MFIAMNRFKVITGSQADFERVWTMRDTHLREVPGFVEFHLLRGPEREDHVLFASHTVWRSRAHFEAWTKSEAFRLAHQSSRLGPNRKHSVLLTRAPGRTSRFISGIPSSRGLRLSRRLTRRSLEAAQE
jgi:heme-degrading monooxygenase HmoA